MSLLACVTRPPLIPFPHSYIKGWLPLLHLYFYTNLKAIQPNKGKSWLFSHSSSSSHTHPPKHTTKPTLNCLFKIYKEEKLASCVTMIQELFGGGASTGLLGERKISLSGVLETRSPSPSISTSSSTTTTPATSSAPQTTSENQNLRCPRCDSANTKFCYYNNYNLTQPRHFCKTCRRYWTKGGALRNVPIGGGCRKNKSTTVVASPVGKAISTSKLKTVVMSSDIGKSGFMSGFDHELPSNPILWGGPSQSCQLLALLRATNQSPNPNPNFSSNPVNTVKDEGFMNIGSSSMATSDASLNGRNFGFDSMGQVPSIGMCSSFWRNNISNQAPHEQQQNGGFVLGEIQNTTGMNSSQLYQRLRSSPVGNYYHSDQTPVILGNVASSSSPSTILESSPVACGELGFWNPALSWSDLSTVNGAYP